MKLPKRVVLNLNREYFWSRPTPGSFCTFRVGRNKICASAYWYTCREEFQWDYPRANKILFCCEQNQIKRIEKVIKDVENRLKIKPRTLCGSSSNRNIMYLDVSPWWNTTLRRSLFLALIKDARFTSSINKLSDYGHYIDGTKPAFSLFLRGYTKLSRSYDPFTPSNGWVATFSGQSMERVKKRLKRA
jgi:hypothetical protein